MALGKRVVSYLFLLISFVFSFGFTGKHCNCHLYVWILSGHTTIFAKTLPREHKMSVMNFTLARYVKACASIVQTWPILHIHNKTIEQIIALKYCTRFHFIRLYKAIR